MWLGGAHRSFEPDLFQRRLKVMIGAVLVAFSFVGARLFALQVIQGNNLLKSSEQNRLQLIFLRAPRGLVFGACLLYTSPSPRD